ncbi:MAG TPA: hypothetical protein VE987_01305 [Polyangiaceae bacterium]|nr:hypothetical protein [Polyangiaceae bacterium]
MTVARSAGAPRALLLVGALLAVVGLAAAATSSPAAGPPGASSGGELVGGVALIAGWLALAWGIHRFGRG